jgi:D-aminopeptidase
MTADATAAVDRNVSTFVLEPSITLRMVFLRAVHADMVELLPESRRINGWTVEWTGKDMPSVYKAMRAMLGLSAIEPLST